MPRLLSNKQPTKKIEPRISNELNKLPTKDQANKPLLEVRVSEHGKPNPYYMEYQIREFTASEYWKYIMRFGKRKMTRDEWEIWSGKRQWQEEHRYENYLLK